MILLFPIAQVKKKKKRKNKKIRPEPKRRSENESKMGAELWCLFMFTVLSGLVWSL